MMEEIPFDLERFKAGDVAIDDSGIEMRFSHSNGEGYFVTNTGVSIYSDPSMSHLSVSRNWSMKPSPTESPWVKWDGGECPIPWAEAGEFEIKTTFDPRGFRSYDTPAVRRCWWKDLNNRITHFRLTQGWLYVPGDGTIPEEIKGAKAWGWEYKCRDGYGSVSAGRPTDNYEWKHRNEDSDIVAVRRVRKEVSGGEVYATISAKDARPDLLKMVERLNKQIAETIGMPAHMLSPSKKEKPARSETPQQSRNREAYLRYKAAHPDPLPAPPAMGQDGIESAIFAALCESMRKEGR